MQFSEKLVFLREKHGLSQEELAEKLDVSRQTISNWENGKVAVDASKAVEICRLFDVDMNYLFLDDGKIAELPPKADLKDKLQCSNGNLNKRNRSIFVACCVVVLVFALITLIFTAIRLSYNDDVASSTITLTEHAGLIILVIVGFLTILLTTISLIILLRRK